VIGIIGGSGLYNIEGVVIQKRRKISTPYGSPSDAYVFGRFSGREVIFLPRHGSQHKIPPHRINYRANIWGFKKFGVERIIAVGATGGIGIEMKPGTIVIFDQIIDMTHGRESTFFDGETGVIHIDFTRPFCPEIHAALLRAGRNSGIKLRKTGTYVCTNGPRLETKAEIQFFSGIGGHVVGMTAMPEALLAREAEICYAGIAIITNYAAGIKEKRLTAKEVIEIMHKTTGQLGELIKKALPLITMQRACACKEALKEAKV